MARQPDQHPDELHVAEEWRVGPDEWAHAIDTFEGSQLVVAGPGTGKTQFLVERTARLVNSGAATPPEILLLTFSRRAAAELRARVSAALGHRHAELSASTFHSFAHRLLERHGGNAFGWSEMPSILTAPEQVALVGELLSEEDRADWPVLFRPLLGQRAFADEVAEFIMRAQERMYGPDDLAQLAAERDDWRALPALLKRYQARLDELGRLDYGSLQTAAVSALDVAAVHLEVSTAHPFVLVDEYQDTTVTQATLLRSLTRAAGNITAAADPYQSIYAFRGTELDNVARFPTAFAEEDGVPARRIILTHSRRVPAAILEAAERLTRGVELPGVAGEVVPADHPGRVEVYVFDQHTREADWIAAEVQHRHIEEQIPYSQIAVLVRTKRRFLNELSRALDRRGVPHDPPSARLLDQPAVGIVADLITASHSNDVIAVDEAIGRLLLGPLFQLSLAQYRALLRERARGETSWDELLDGIAGADDLARLRSDSSWHSSLPAADGFWRLWTELPRLSDFVSRHGAAADRSALSSLSQQLNRLVERDPSMTLHQFFDASEEIEASPLLSFRKSAEDQVVLTTLHQAKGLEFDVVFIADAVEGAFPDLRRRRSLLQTDQLGTSQGPLEPRIREEVRLAYMAMTRARKRVVWTATQAGIDEGQTRPSRFLGWIWSEADPGPPDERTTPVTPFEAEAFLRAMLASPTEGPANRLAAASALLDAPSPYRPVSEFSMIMERGPDRGVVSEPLSLSPSRAAEYEQCPRRYVLQSRLRFGYQDSIYARFGTLIHDVLEEAEQAALDRNDSRSTLEEALGMLDRRFADLDFGPPTFRAAWRARAVQLLGKLYEHWPRPRATPVTLERDFVAELDGVHWKGRADRIEDVGDGNLRIVDYKTGKRVPTKAEAVDSLQLGFYLWAARHDEDLVALGTPRYAESWHPAASSKKPAVREFELGRLELITERMKTVAEGVLAEDWTARPSRACERCEVRLVCPAFPEGREAFHP